MNTHTLDHIVAIILTNNEEVHIERCIRSIKPVATRIVVVDSFSTDKTVDIARSLGAEVVQRKWKNYADQFQWGLDYCAVQAGWIMRIDADEYLESSLQEEILGVIPTLPDTVSGIYIKLKVIYKGKWIKHGGIYPLTLLRIWRAGKGRIEQRWMDEHIVLPTEAKTIVLKSHSADSSLKDITFWINKHNHYATREMVDILINKYFSEKKDEVLKQMADPQARWKRILKDKIYSKFPLGLRSVLYFFYRYFIKLGFLDGSKGFIWHFMQGFWYRLLVDVKVMEVEAQAGGDPQKVISILRDQYGIEI